MLKEKGLDPAILALLQRSSLDAVNQLSWSEELRRQGFEKWIQTIRFVVQQLAGTPERAWLLFSFILILETITVARVRLKRINATHEQFEFGFSALLLSPVFYSIMAFIRSLQAEDMAMTSKPRKYCFIAWLMSTCVGLLLSFLSKSSILLGLALTVPLMVACLSIAIPIWINNGYRFCMPPVDQTSNMHGCCHMLKEGLAMGISVTIFIFSVIALGTIISVKPLDDLDYRGWNGDQESFTSPYTSSFYLGWAIASAFALTITGILPVVSWFATYRYFL